MTGFSRLWHNLAINRPPHSSEITDSYRFSRIENLFLIGLALLALLAFWILVPRGIPLELPLVASCLDIFIAISSYLIFLMMMMVHGSKADARKTLSASSLFVVGAFSAFHAFFADQEDTQAIISLGDLVGGLVFGLILLPEALRKTFASRWTPLLFFSAALLGGSSLAFLIDSPFVRTVVDFPWFFHLPAFLGYGLGGLRLLAKHSTGRDARMLGWMGLILALSALLSPIPEMWTRLWWFAAFAKASAFLLALILFLQSIHLVLLKLWKSNEEIQTLNDKLQASVLELNATNKELKSFTYAASHDLQEPLRTISNYLGIIEEDYAKHFDPEGREYLGFTISASKRLKNLIEELLVFSRIQRSAAPLLPTSLSMMADVALSHLALAAEEENADITKEELPTIFGDETQLIYLFQNLLSNSIRYRHPERSPQIRIRSTSPPEGGWTLEFEDKGMGIPAEHHEEIFQPFHRLHAASQIPGSGLGLAICRRVMTYHQGSIHVLRSEPGRGTTIALHFPAKIQETSDLENGTQSA
ncbi:MAG: ATP-binding protein [Verrucomicrobiota bacterium]